MTTFFHVAPSGLKPGNIVQPGTWGQKIRTWQKGRTTFANHQEAYVLIWEVVLEATRRNLASAAPSRLDCVFGCCTHGDAVAFRDRFQIGHDIYPIDVASGTPTYVGDYDLITNSIAGPFVDTFVDQAFRYWTSPPVGMREVLIGGLAVVK